MKKKYPLSIVSFIFWSLSPVYAAENIVHIPTPTVADENITADSNFQLISAGNFMMGTPKDPNLEREDNEVYHKVTLTQDFEIQKTQVTQLQYFRATGRNPSYFATKVVCPDVYIELDGIGLCPNQPVERISWAEAQEFAKKLSEKSTTYKYKLPTEAEYEYAARAGTTTTHWFGNVPKSNFYEDPIADSSIWYFYSLSSPASTRSVAMLKPNAWGLYDVSGNVGQWVQDSYELMPAKNVKNPRLENSGRYKCFRGGALYAGAHDTRSAYRFFGPADLKVYDVGIRLVRVPSK